MFALALCSLVAVAAAPLPDAGQPTHVALRLRAAGDVMLGTEEPAGYLPPDDAAQSLSDVKALLADADATFVNLEGPLCDDGTSSKCKSRGTCYAFRSPTRYAKYLVEAGIDFGSTANNHSGDFGESCRRATEKTLDEAGITWSGPPGSIGLRTVNGKKVALVAFHTSGSCNDLNDLKSAVALVTKAVEQADLVIVSFHGGAEGTRATHVIKGAEKYLGENRGDLVTFTHAVIDAGADLVLGHGPHVVRGLERYRDRLIVYSMGNFATYGRFDLSGPLAVGVIVEASLADDGHFVEGRLFATKQVDKGIPKRDESGRAIKLIKQLTAEDFGQAGLRIADDGAVTPAD